MRIRTSWATPGLALALALTAGCTDLLSDKVVEMAKGEAEVPELPPAEPPPPPPPPPPTPVQGLLPSSPTLPFNAARIDEAKVRTELYNARHAVRGYKMLNRKYPSSLSDLQLRLKFGADLDYDSSTGQVKSRTYPQY